MRTMTPRQHKVANEVHHLCATALMQGRVPSTLPTSRMTVLDCWISADLRLARLYIQLPKGADQAAFFADANAQLSKPLRKILATQLGTKYIPDVSFHPAEETV